MAANKSDVEISNRLEKLEIMNDGIIKPFRAGGVI